MLRYLSGLYLQIVSSCVCVVIPNLTRAVCSYAFIKNVVTHKDYCAKAFATECLDYTKQIAKAENCYKMMLLTGSKKESTKNSTNAPTITAVKKKHSSSGLSSEL